MTARDPGDWIDEQLADIAREGPRRGASLRPAELTGRTRSARGSTGRCRRGVGVGALGGWGAGGGATGAWAEGDGFGARPCGSSARDCVTAVRVSRRSTARSPRDRVSAPRPGAHRARGAHSCEPRSARPAVSRRAVRAGGVLGSGAGAPRPCRRAARAGSSPGPRPSSAPPASAAAAEPASVRREASMPGARPPSRATRPRYTRLPWRRAPDLRPHPHPRPADADDDRRDAILDQVQQRIESEGDARVASTTGASARLTFEIDHQNEAEYLLLPVQRPGVAARGARPPAADRRRVLRFRIIKSCRGTPPPPEVRVEPVAAEY